ncbi:hypothetical protein JCM10207_006181 [Rhodosporidiobolus poonsookiae]
MDAGKEHTIVQLHEGEGLSFAQISAALKNRSANAISLRYCARKRKDREALGLEPDGRKGRYVIVRAGASPPLGFGWANLKNQGAVLSESEESESESEEEASPRLGLRLLFLFRRLQRHVAPLHQPVGPRHLFLHPLVPRILPARNSPVSSSTLSKPNAAALRQAKGASRKQAIKARSQRRSVLFAEMDRLRTAMKAAEDELEAINVEEDKAVAEELEDELEDEL